MSAAAAVITVLRALAAVIEGNEDGVRRDLDCEFLHDYRVAVRRTRTALSQVRGVLPRTHVDRFRRDFSWLAAASGPTRDLDVLMQKMPECRLQLPAQQRGLLEPIEAHLAAARRREHERLVSALGSERYALLIADWHEFLADPDQLPEAPPSAGEPISTVAAREVGRVWRKVLLRGREIDDTSPRERLHRLRIRGKKLRYLLEFFRSLAPAGEVTAAIRELKKLQDNLGDFNDCRVQQRMLEEVATELAATGRASPGSLLAGGRLIERLWQDEQVQRKLFGRRFARFASDRSTESFARLIAAFERSGRP
jgi:CHAD domain-containing protein